MNPTIYLSCLVVIFGSLAWTASADQEFQAELARLKNIYGNDAVHQVTKYRNVPELMNFYEKYSNRFQLTYAEKQEADRALMRYKEDNKRRVDGSPPQGGFWDELVRVVITTIGEVLKKPIAHIGKTYKVIDD